MRLAVHVTPKAGRDEVVGWRGGELSVKVAAAPEGGRANAAVCALIARDLRIAKTAVRVVRGQNGRHKQLEIDGVGEDELATAFGRPPESLF